MHLLLSSRNSNARSAFKCFVMTNWSKEIKDLHDWPHHVFARRSREIPVLDDAACRERAMYIVLHGEKERLVEQGRDWPGIPWTSAVATGAPLVGTWYNRTALYEANRNWTRRRPSRRGPAPVLQDYGEAVEVKLHPLPYLADLTEETIRRDWREILEEGRFKFGVATDPAAVLGVEKLLGQHPHTRPNSSSRRRAPRAHFRDPAAFSGWREDYGNFVTALRSLAQSCPMAQGLREHSASFCVRAGPQSRRDAMPNQPSHVA
jgi:hypothetical protein